MTHIYIYSSLNWVIIGSCNGLSPIRRPAITRTNDDLLSIELLGTKFTEILFIEIKTVVLKILYLKESSAKVAAILSRPQCAREWNHIRINIFTMSVYDKDPK